MDYKIPNDLSYTADDEWIRTKDDIVTIGVTDFAQEQLGDIVFVELPEPGTNVTRGEPFGVIESVKAVSDLVAPLSGEVLRVNQQLEDTPELVNANCYSEGWMLEVRPSDPSEFAQLQDAKTYIQGIEERSD